MNLTSWKVMEFFFCELCSVRDCYIAWLHFQSQEISQMIIDISRSNISQMIIDISMSNISQMIIDISRSNNSQMIIDISRSNICLGFIHFFIFFVHVLYVRCILICVNVVCTAIANNLKRYYYNCSHIWAFQFAYLLLTVAYSKGQCHTHFDCKYIYIYIYIYIPD